MARLPRRHRAAAPGGPNGSVGGALDRLPPRLWRLCGALACAVILAVGWFTLIAPARTQVAALRSQVTAAQDATASASARLGALQRQSRRLPDLQARLAALQAQLPGTPALADLVRDLSAAASSSGVDLVSLTPSQPVPLVGAIGAVASPTAPGPGGLAAIPVSLSVAGPYPGVRTFVHALQSLPRALSVTGLTITAGGATVTGSAAPGAVTAAITGRVFLDPALDVPAPGTAPSARPAA